MNDLEEPDDAEVEDLNLGNVDDPG